MTTYSREEIMSSSEVVRNFGSVLASIAGHKRDKVAIIRNNRMEAVLVPIDEYERMQEICEIAEQFELYGVIADRSKTPPEQYISLADAMKKCGVKTDEL
jgi:PHD/YefM family antitoxin component YafN of YafNO toxin-antitoxin module